MEPTTVAACDAALADLRLRLQVAEAEDNADAWMVLSDRCDDILDLRLAIKSSPAPSLLRTGSARGQSEGES